jgi:hypothetical protein
MEQDKTIFKRGLFLAVLVLYALAFCYFYLRYVPLVRGFQAVLLPLLVAVLVLTIRSHRWGLLFFVGLFPLINNLPYLFRIFPDTPHAPTALVLFLVFFWGWLFRFGLQPRLGIMQNRISRPFLLFALIVLFSGIITFLRFTNFFPFLSYHFRDLMVNVYGVRAGGAVMSTLFSALSYLSGFLFFLVIVTTVQTREFLKKILRLLSLSVLLSFLFGLFQNFHSLELGNTPFFITMGRINSTFKDPNSFGLFAAALIPIFLGFSIKDKKGRPFWIILLLLALIVFPPIGSRSAMLGLVFGSALFLFLALLGSQISSKRRWTYVSLVLVGVCVVAGIFLVVAKGSNLYLRIQQNLNQVLDPSTLNQVVDIGRVEFWRTALQLIGHYPVSGVGIGAYIIELPNFTVLRGYAAGHTDSAENYFLQVTAELGVLGLLAVIWLFFEVMRMLFRNRSRLSREDPDRFLYFGIISALAVVFINLFFHSYIGAFDVKYLIWLLVGLAFRFPEKNGAAQKTSFSCSQPVRITLGLVLIAFAVSQLWDATHTLSLKQAALRFDWEQNFGLYHGEVDQEGQKFNWTRREAGISFENTRETVLIPLRASHPNIQKIPVKVRIFQTDSVFRNPELVGEVELRSSRWRFFEFSPGGLSDKRIFLMLEVDRVWQPWKAQGVPDKRWLGIAVGEIDYR